MLDAATRTCLDRSTDRTETMDRLATPRCHLATDSFVVPDEHGEVLGFAHELRMVADLSGSQLQTASLDVDAEMSQTRFDCTAGLG